MQAAGFGEIARHEVGKRWADAGGDRKGSPLNSAACWLSPFASALKVQAKRKGFSECTKILDGLQHILSQQDISWSEKLDRCRALVLDGADDLVESLEALVDLTGACSAPQAFWTHSLSPTPESILQLAPIMILLSLVAAHAARRGATNVFGPMDVASP